MRIRREPLRLAAFLVIVVATGICLSPVAAFRPIYPLLQSPRPWGLENSPETESFLALVLSRDLATAGSREDPHSVRPKYRIFSLVRLAGTKSLDLEAETSSEASLPLWEVIRELGQRQVDFNVLQPREELDALLYQARLGKVNTKSERVASTGTASSSRPLPGATERKEEAVALASQAKNVSQTPPRGDLEARLPSVSFAPPSLAPLPVLSASEAGTASTGPLTRRPPPPPSVAAAALPRFHSIADALAWAGSLSKEEIVVELEFLRVRYEGGAAEAPGSHTELARLLARSVVSEGRGQGPRGREYTGVGAMRVGDTGEALEPVLRVETYEGGASMAEAAAGLWDARLEGEKGTEQAGGSEREVEADGMEEEGEAVDLARVREDLGALRSRALRAAATLRGRADPRGRHRDGEDHAEDPWTQDRAPFAPITPPGVRPKSAEPSQAPGRARAGSRRRGAGRARRRASREEEGWDGGEDRDLALRVLEGVSRKAETAWEWATRARGVARGAMMAATTAGVDSDGPRRTPAGSRRAEKAATLRQRSRTLLGPRGRRWSRLTGLMARAWAESAWQIVLASASWAGGGVLPGKYVLVGAGALALLLRRGVGAYLGTLLVVRTCSSSLRNLMEDEEEDEEEGEV